MKRIYLAMSLVTALCANTAMANCNKLKNIDFESALKTVVGMDNGGFGFNMWLTVVNRDGKVCGVFKSGNPGEQWPGSRVISAQKANTANAFSLPGLALSTANLYSAVQPGGSLYGLQHSNPVDPKVAYKGNGNVWGTNGDPLKNKKVGGVNVFGGGLAIYNNSGKLIGALGVSGDTSCADHVIAWRVRDLVGLDNIPGGVSPTGDDNIIFDISADMDGHNASASGFGHPVCGFGADAVAEQLPITNPIGS